MTTEALRGLDAAHGLADGLEAILENAPATGRFDEVRLGPAAVHQGVIRRNDVGPGERRRMAIDGRSAAEPRFATGPRLVWESVSLNLTRSIRRFDGKDHWREARSGGVLSHDRIAQGIDRAGVETIV